VTFVSTDIDQAERSVTGLKARAEACSSRPILRALPSTLQLGKSR